MADPKDMYRCPVSNCGYVYDPDRGDKRRKIPAGTRFEDLPEDWTCPVCGIDRKAGHDEASGIYKLLSHGVIEITRPSSGETSYYKAAWTLCSSIAPTAR